MPGYLTVPAGAGTVADGSVTPAKLSFDPATQVELDAEAVLRSSGDTQIAANTQIASYTLALADAGKSVEMSLGTATVLTVPTNAAVAFPVGTVIEVCRLGAGTVTLTPATGVVLRNRLEAAGTTSRTITAQYSTVSLRKRAADEWVLVGDLA